MSRATVSALIGGLILISTACAPGRSVVRGNWPDGRISIPVGARQAAAPRAPLAPAPEPAEEWLPPSEAADSGESAADLNRRGVLQPIHFAYDRADIALSEMSILEANAAWLAANPGASIIIEGHCDERGTGEYNENLGWRRATASRDYLVSMGIDPSRLEVVSFGEQVPVVRGRDESAWSANRRADFVIVSMNRY